MLPLLNVLTVLALLVLIAAGGAILLGGVLTSTDPLRWHKLGAFLGVLVLGWVFIMWSNKFHITAPVVMVCLGFLAITATMVNLWRTGAAAVAPPGSEDEQWGRPLGKRGELEKEKRTLLKAIKEAEFDHAMGKLSKADVDQLVRSYRARAIEVIKALDQLDGGEALDTKAKIQREVKARLELALSDKPSKRAKNAAEMKAAKADAKAKAEDAKADAKAKAEDAKADAKAKAEDAKADAKAKADDAKADDDKVDAPTMTAKDEEHAIDMPGGGN